MSALIIRFEKNGKRLPVTGFTKTGGLEFSKERLARARQFGVEYGWPSQSTAAGKRTIEAIRKYQRKHGLEGNDLSLKVTVEGGEMVVTGAAGPLPAGEYWCRLQIEDTKLAKRRQEFTLAKGVPTLLVLKAEDDAGAIRLTKPVSEFSPMVRRLVESDSSRVDQRPLADWLQDEDVRAKRRACLLNILAKLRAIGDGRRSFLIKHVKNVYLVDSDRVHAEVERSFLDALRELAKDNREVFVPETSPSSSTHRQLINKKRWAGGGFPHPLALRDFREMARPSLQAVVGVPISSKPVGKGKHAPKSEVKGGRHLVDLDMDLGVVTMDLLGAFTHFGEIIMPGRTNHLSVGKKLAKDPKAGKYVYYEVTRGG